MSKWSVARNCTIPILVGLVAVVVVLYSKLAVLAVWGSRKGWVPPHSRQVKSVKLFELDTEIPEGISYLLSHNRIFYMFYNKGRIILAF